MLRSWDPRDVEDKPSNLVDFSPGREEGRGDKEQAGGGSVQYLVRCRQQPP